MIIATHNAGKLKEIQSFMSPFGILCQSAGALALAEPEENGSSFVENAMIKARAAALSTGEASLADDSGLVIPALGGAPGIHSARWAGAGKDFSVAFARIQAELAQAQQPLDAPCYFVCVLSLALPASQAVKLSDTQQSEHYTLHHVMEDVLQYINIEGRVHGHLCFPPRGAHGFGYDPVFIPQDHTQSFAEMPVAEKAAISHRSRAFAGLASVLAQLPL